VRLRRQGAERRRSVDPPAFAVDSLDESAARAAPQKPIIEAGAAIEDGAIKAVLDVTQGYPYFIQE